MNEKTVRTCLKKLASIKLIATETRRIDGVNLTNIYRLNLGGVLPKLGVGGGTPKIGSRVLPKLGDESVTESISKEEEKSTHPSNKITIKDKDYHWPSPEALIALYNSEAAEELPAVSVISPGRVKKAKEYLTKFPSVEFWKEVFEETKLSPFLRGLKKNGRGHDHFKASFDWLLTKGTTDQIENCVKTSEGRYREDE